MKFTSLGSGFIKITLDYCDVERLGVNYKDMDYADFNTKKIILELLSFAKEEIGFDAEGKKLHVQIYPQGEGGLEMYISKFPQGKTSPKDRLYKFNDLESTLEALRYLEKINKIYSSRLYAEGNSWYINTKAELSEYAKEETRRFFVYHLIEYNTQIGRGKELLALLKALSP